TSAEIAGVRLRAHPVVILGACHAGQTAAGFREPWSLATAFIAAGARAVVASPDEIADGDAGPFFDGLRARMAAGATPAIALRDQRLDWLRQHPASTWVSSLMVFE